MIGQSLGLLLLGICLLGGGGALVYAASREQVPRFLKMWSPLKGPPRHTMSDDSARMLASLVGVMVAAGGLALSIGGIALLIGRLSRSLK